MNDELSESVALGLGRVAVTLAITAAVLLAGCGSKPPGCADSDVKQSVIDTALQQALKGDGDVPGYHSYYKKAKLELVGVTTDGYDQEARRHACQATLAVTDSHDATNIAITYSVQAIEGSRGEYRVAYYDTGYPLRLTLMGKAQKYLMDYAPEEKNKPAPPTYKYEVVVPEKSAEPEPKPTIVQSAANASAPIAGISLTATTVVTAPPDVGQNSTPQENPPAAASVQTLTPSFSCGGRLSASEQLVCASPALSDADAKMAALYAQAVAKSADPSSVKRDQRAWRKARDSCSEILCMQASYDNRNRELTR